MLAWDYTVQSDVEFGKYLDQLIEYTGINRDELFDECYNINNFINFSSESLLQIAKNLKVDPILLWKKQLDFEVLKSTQEGTMLLPKCYTEVCNSKIVSLQNVLEQYKQYNLYDYALKKLQINEKIFSENRAISVLAISDIFDFSSGFFTKKDYEAIATRNSTYAYDNILKKEISMNLSKIKKAERMFELVCFFEQNWNYRILRSDLNSITIGTLESEEMRSAKTYRSFTNNMTTFGRFSFCEQALGFLGVRSHGVITNSGWDNEERSFSFTVNLN